MFDGDYIGYLDQTIWNEVDIWIGKENNFLTDTSVRKVLRILAISWWHLISYAMIVAQFGEFSNPSF